MTGLDSTSFDRHARYSYLRQLRARLPPSRLRVLDVGDPYGTLRAVLPDDDTVSVDLFSDGWPNVGRHSHVQGSGFELPFAGATFDVVASHDVVEHLPAGSVEDFVAELVRVSRGPVVVVAPFDDPRTTRCEAIVRAYYRLRTGRPLEPLEEHASGDGLPALDRLEGWLAGRGLTWCTYGGGWLHHWLAMMLLKAHFASSGDITSDRSFDAAFIDGAEGADEARPWYRRALVIGEAPALDRPLAAAPEPLEEVERQRLELSDLAWTLAGSLEPGRSPLEPGSKFEALVGAGGELARRSPALASSLGGLCGAIHAALPAATAPVSVVVAAMPGGPGLDGCLAALRPQVEACGGEIVVVAGEPGDLPPGVADGAGLRIVVEPAADRILRTNRGVQAAEGDTVLFLDPGLAVPPGLVAGLLEAYRPDQSVGCVAARLAGRTVSPLRAALRSVEGPFGAEVLYAPREAMLIGRELYSGLAGFDGAMLGVLDDVELGMRIRRRGDRIRLAGPVCRWRHAPPPWDPVAAEAEAAAALRILFVTSPPGEVWARVGPELEAAAHRFAGTRSRVEAIVAACVEGDPADHHPAEVAADVRALRARREQLAPLMVVPGDLDVGFGGLHVGHLAGPAAEEGGETPAPDVLVVADSPRMLALAAALRAAGVGEIVVEDAGGPGKPPRQVTAPVVVASEEAFVLDPGGFEAAPHLIIDATSSRAGRTSALRSADALVCASPAQRDELLASPAFRIPVVAAPCVPEVHDLVAAAGARGRSRLAAPDGIVVDGRGGGEARALTLAASLAGRIPGGGPIQVLGEWSDDPSAESGSLARTPDPAVMASAAVVVVAGDGGSALEALGWGAPVVCGPGDPAAAMVDRYGAGAVADGEAAQVDAAGRLAASPVLLARAGAAAALLAVGTRRDAAEALRALPGLAPRT